LDPKRSRVKTKTSAGPCCLPLRWEEELPFLVPGAGTQRSSGRLVWGKRPGSELKKWKKLKSMADRNNSQAWVKN